MWPSLLFAAALILGAVGLLLWHVYDWGQAQRLSLTETELQYQRQRFYRRTLASSLVAVAGITIVVGEWVIEPLFMIFLWVTLIALLGWIVAIAAADWAATRRYYTQARAEQQAEHAALRQEIEAYRRESRSHWNGNRDKSQSG